MQTDVMCIFYLSKNFPNYSSLDYCNTRTISKKVTNILSYKNTFNKYSSKPATSSGHLISTLISENQGGEKLRSVSNFRKISGPAQLNFFQYTWICFSLSTGFFFHICTINLKKNQVTNWKKTQVYWKKFSCAGPEIFLRFWNRP